MKYENIQNYFEEGIEGINKLIAAMKDSIETIENYQGMFKTNLLTEEADLKEALNILTGLYSESNIIAGIADAYAETNEAREILLAKNSQVDDGKGGKKSPTDDQAKYLGRSNNLIYLRTANLFKSYKEVCLQKIMTCQSQLNYLKKPIPPQG